jgi:hypothetical protein
LGQVQAYNPITWEVEEGGFKFQASLDYIVRPYLKKKKGKKGSISDFSSIFIKMSKDTGTYTH